MGRKLYRDERSRVIGGVAAGLAEYLELDVTIVRILFIVLAVFGLSGVLVYIVLWIAVPKKLYSYDIPGAFQNQADYTMPDHTNFSSQPAGSKKSGSGRYWVGLVLIVMGLAFLFKEFDIIPYWFNMRKLWPAFIIILGLWILFRPSTYRAKIHQATADPEVKSTVPPESNSSTINPDQPII